MRTIKTSELKAGDRVVLPADWPEQGIRAERVRVFEVEEDTFSYEVHEDDRDPTDTASNQAEAGLDGLPDELETWE